MKPTIGRVVIYNTTETDRTALTQFGNESNKLPATVVAVWGDNENAAINLKVETDGNLPAMWKTSVIRGDNPGEWNWPVIQK